MSEQTAENDGGLCHRLYRTPLLRFTCDRCGAGVGEECQTASGQVAQYQHAARYAAEAAYYQSQENIPPGVIHEQRDGVCVGCAEGGRPVEWLLAEARGHSDERDIPPGAQLSCPVDPHGRPCTGGDYACCHTPPGSPAQ